MCRLLAYVSPAPTTIEATLGRPVLDQFTALSLLHGDGWGTAWMPSAPGAKGQLSYRSPGPARSDPAFVEQTRFEPSRSRIVHLRWASPGLRVQAENTHPFSDGSLNFAHNGSLMPPGAIASLLDDSTRRSLVGSTDSERYFALIRQEMAAGPGDVVAAVRRAVITLRAIFPIASLNALLLTDAELVVIHANSVEDAPKLTELSNTGSAPLDHLEAYFLMRSRRSDDGTISFTSSGLPQDGWLPLPDDSITSVDIDSLTMTTVPIIEMNRRSTP